MWKDINYDCGGFSRKLQSELVAQKGAWMEMRWPRPIWCFLGTLNWSQFPSLLRQPLTGSVSISFVLLVRFDEQSWWDNAPAKYNQLKWWNAQQMWIKRKRCKFLEDQIDSLMWHLIYKTVWFEPKFNRKFRFGTLTLAGPGSSSGEFVARRQTSLHLLRMFRKKPKDVCFLGVLRGLPDLLQYYIREGGYMCKNCFGMCKNYFGRAGGKTILAGGKIILSDGKIVFLQVGKLSSQSAPIPE